MTDPAGSKITNIIQGSYGLSKDPDMLLSTILGSCVAVCLWDDRARIGGMNHFLLPTGQGADVGHVRYGVNAMEILVNELLKGGADRRGLQAKIFGGARMSANLADIGSSNARFAEDFLANEDIPLVSHSTGGTLARRVVFHPVTGRARVLIVPGAVPRLADAPPPTAPARREGIILF